MTKLADLIWDNAKLLRGKYKENEYRKVIIPFTILRRLDCVLAETRDAVIKKHKEIKEKGYDLDKFLTIASGYAFYNTSNFTFESLLDAPDNLKDNLEAMVNGFSTNVRDIFEKLQFLSVIEKLDEKDLLFLVTQEFAKANLDPKIVSNHDMGQAFEELLRKFNDVSPAGEQYTPRDAIELMVNMLFEGDDEVLSVPGINRTIYDPTAGTGGMLSVAEEHLKKLNPRASLKLFGQESEDETYAICKADMLIRGQDPENIANGDTLAMDKHPNERFEYMLSNPPYGDEWKPAEDAVRKEHKLGAKGRFAPGLPSIRDGQMLFTLHLLSKMREFKGGKGGARIGVVHNASPLFSGDAGGGESEIRRYILDMDYLDCIVQLPKNMFYNTDITTYLWFLTNRKPLAHKDKVLLIDASGMSNLMPKNLGKKRRELSKDCIHRICETYSGYKDSEWRDEFRSLRAKVFDKSNFYYRRLTIDKPLKMKFVIGGEEEIQKFFKGKNFMGLKEEQRTFLIEVLPKLAGKEYKNLNLLLKDLHAEKQVASKTSDVLRRQFGVKSPDGEAILSKKGSIEPDVDLRDYEYVPFTKSIEDYFNELIKPQNPESWINQSVVDDKDGKVGIVGIEFNFNKEFYVYQPSRKKAEIKKQLEHMEYQFLEKLKGI